MVTKLIVILTLAASTAGVYALQHRREAADALPAADGVEIPRIVVTAKREHGAE